MPATVDETKGRSSRGAEPIAGYFASLVRIVGDFAKLRKFWRTRRHVMTGARLYDWSSKALAEADLMPPLTFNVYETVLAAAPASAVSSTINILMPLAESPSNDITELLRGYDHPVAREIINVWASVDGFWTPFYIPTIQLALACVISWTAIKYRHTSRLKRRRTRDAALYYDGAYSLWPVGILSLIQTVWDELGVRHVNTTLLSFPFAAIWFVSSAYVLWTTFIVIPSRLFSLNRYVSRYLFARILRAFRRRRIRVEHAPPTLQYFLLTPVVGAAVLVVAVGALGLCQFGTAVGLAAVRVWMRSHLGQ